MAEEKVEVLIIGSGHSGGMVAKVLTEKGISCLMLNAGPVVDFKKTANLNQPTNCRIADSICRAACRTFFRPMNLTPIPG